MYRASACSGLIFKYVSCTCWYLDTGTVYPMKVQFILFIVLPRTVLICSTLLISSLFSLSICLGPGVCTFLTYCAQSISSLPSTNSICTCWLFPFRKLSQSISFSLHLLSFMMAAIWSLM